MPQKKVFISHSTKDKDLVDAFVDLLQTGIGIPTNEIFCSSIEGTNIPPGKNVIEYIKEQLQSPQIVIAILSPSYYESTFCICELGATWALTNEMLPLLVPPLNYENIKDVLTAVQLSRIDNDLQLSQMRDRLVSVLGLRTQETTRWEQKRNQFLRKAKELLSAVAPPTRISFKEHQELEAKYQALLSDIEELQIQNEKHEQYISELEQAKDAASVANIRKKYTSADDELQTAISAASKALQGLPNGVATVMYRTHTGEDTVSFDPFEDKGAAEELEEAAKDGFLRRIEDCYGLNHSDPQVANALEALEHLKWLLNSGDKEIAAAIEQLEREDGFESSLGSRRFWREHLASVK